MIINILKVFVMELLVSTGSRILKEKLFGRPDQEDGRKATVH